MSIFLLAYTAASALAITDTDAIDTNRPSFMFSPLVVPQGSLQLENGTLYQGFRGNKWSYNIPETQVRVGLLKSTEFQMFVPNYVLQYNSGTSTGYASDITDLGLKIHLGPESAAYNKPRYNISVITSLTLPTGSSTVSGSGVQPAVRIPWGVSLNKHWLLMGMQSLAVVNSGRNVQWTPDFMLSRVLGSHASAFIEYESVLTHDAQPRNIIHFGSVYKITHNQQVDLQFGFGLNKAAPTAFVGVGYSFRFCTMH